MCVSVCICVVLCVSVCECCYCSLSLHRLKAFIITNCVNIGTLSRLEHYPQVHGSKLGVCVSGFVSVSVFASVRADSLVGVASESRAMCA